MGISGPDPVFSTLSKFKRILTDSPTPACQLSGPDPVPAQSRNHHVVPIQRVGIGVILAARQLSWILNPNRLFAHPPVVIFGRK